MVQGICFLTLVDVIVNR